MKVQKVFLRTPHNYDRDAASLSSSLLIHEDDLDMCQQSFKEECDINVIMERFGLGAVLPNNVVLPQYGDYSDVMDFQSALNAVRQGGELFMQLPGKLRARFEHDPQKFLEFVNDDSNYEEAQRLGLVPPAPPAAPVPPSGDVEISPAAAVGGGPKGA